jgi:hypothetical protein
MTAEIRGIMPEEIVDIGTAGAGEDVFLPTAGVEDGKVLVVGGRRAAAEEPVAVADFFGAGGVV